MNLVITCSETLILQRGEAIQLLREIIRACADIGMAISYVNLTPVSLNNGLMRYQLKIGTRLDYACRKALMPLLKKKNLELEENEDHIAVFRPEQH